MVQPTNMTSKNAKFGFCSFSIVARKVANKAIPMIFRISIVVPSPHYWNRNTDFIFVNN